MAGTPGPFIGAGATFSFTPTGGTLTPVGLLTKLPIPGFDTDSVAANNNSIAKDTNNAYWKLFLPGWLDGGELEFEALFDPTAYSALFGMRNKPGVGTITLSNGSIVAFPGFIKKLSGENPLEEVVTAAFSFVVTSFITITP